MADEHQEQQQSPTTLDLQLVSSELLWMTQVGHLRQQHPLVSKVHLQLPSSIPPAAAADGVRLLFNFPHLKSLSLRFDGPRARITDGIAAAVAELLPLQCLALQQGRLSGQVQLERWSSLTRLQDLRLLLGAGSGVGDHHMAALSGLTGLTHLQLRGHPRRLTSAGLQQLLGLQQLQQLGVVPLGRRADQEVLQQLLGLPKLQLMQLGMQQSRQVLHFTGLSFPKRVQLQLLLLDPRRLAPSEVLSVFSWCLPHMLMSLRLGTVRSAAPGDVLLLLGTLTALRALSLQVTAIPSKHMCGTMDLTTLSSLTRLSSLECVVSERVYVPLKPSSVALLAAAWPQLTHLVLSVAGKPEVQPAALQELHCLTALHHLQLHYPLPEEVEPLQDNSAAAAAAAAELQRGSSGWWAWIQGSLLGTPTSAAAGAAAPPSAAAEEQGEVADWAAESEEEADSDTDSNSSEGGEEEAVVVRKYGRMASAQSALLRAGGAARGKGTPLRQPSRYSSSSGTLGRGLSSRWPGVSAAGSGALLSSTPGSPLGPLSPHHAQQQLLQQQLSRQQQQQQPMSPVLQQSMSAPLPGASGASGSQLAGSSSTGAKSWASVLGAFCVAPAQLRLLTAGLTGATAAGPAGLLPGANSAPHPLQTSQSWGVQSSGRDSPKLVRGSSAGVPAVGGSPRFSHSSSPTHGRISQASGSSWCDAGLRGLQPLVLSRLPANLQKLSLQGYLLLVDPPAPQPEARSPPAAIAAPPSPATQQQQQLAGGGGSNSCCPGGHIPGNCGSSSSSKGAGVRLGQLQDLELEECAANDAMLLKLMPQLTSLRRLVLRGVLGLTDGGLASLPALTALTQLVLEADEQLDVSLAGLWAVSHLPQLRVLSWTCNDDLPSPLQSSAGGPLLLQSSGLDQAGLGLGWLAASGSPTPLMQHLRALSELRQLRLVVNEPPEPPAAAGGGVPGGGQAAAAGVAGHSGASPAKQSSSDGSKRSSREVQVSQAPEQQASGAVVLPREQLQQAWQGVLAQVLPLCEVSIGFNDELVLEEPLDVWGDLSS